MAPMTEPQRVGVLVVSLWQGGSGDALRARVTETTDVNAVGETTRVVGSLDELLGTVEDWAKSLLHAPSDPLEGAEAPDPIEVGRRRID
jgi:hypothetical protein